MKTITTKELKQLDMYKETEICRYEDKQKLMFFAPNQRWSDKCINQLKKENVFVDRYSGNAVMVYDEIYVVIGTEDDGCISFMKGRHPLGYSKAQDFENTYHNANVTALISLLDQALTSLETDKFRPITLAEFRNIKKGDVVYYQMHDGFKKTKACADAYYNADSDEPDWEVETTHGFCHWSSVCVLKEGN